MKYTVLYLTIIFGISITLPTSAGALEAHKKCAPIETIFARGSGSGGVADAAANKFSTQLKSSLGSEKDGSFNNYFLGTETYDGFKYPHVAISGNFDSLKNGAGALSTNGEGYDYGKSADDGVGELVGYINKRMFSCPDAKYILGGFSQGAHVVADSLSRLNINQRRKISYVALFGNPKLHLPEGDSHKHGIELLKKGLRGNPLLFRRGMEFLPDACYGVNFSPWRSVVDDCRTHRGALYVSSDKQYPSDIEKRIHEWCFDKDGICNSREAAWGAGHDQYTEFKGIPQAVAEALAAAGAPIDKPIIGLGDPNKKYDILFEIPVRCTPLFRFEQPIPSLAVPYKILELQSTGRQLKILQEIFYDYPPNEEFFSKYVEPRRRPGAEYIRYRVAGVNCLDEHVGITTSQKTSLVDSRRFSALKTIDASSSINNYNSAKIVSEITDDPKCLSSPNCLDISSMPNPQEVVITQATPIWPRSNITNVVDAPITYAVQQNTTSEPYDEYKWDVDDDNITDFTTSLPSLTYTHPTTFSGDINVTAISSTSGLSASAKLQSKILARYAEPIFPAAPSRVTIKKVGNDSVLVNWTKNPSDSTSDTWKVRVDGYPVGRTTLPTTSLTIAEMHFEANEPRTISVSGVSVTGEEGEPTSATIEPNHSTDTPALARTSTDVGNLLSAYERREPAPDRTIPLQSPQGDKAASRDNAPQDYKPKPSAPNKEKTANRLVADKTLNELGSILFIVAGTGVSLALTTLLIYRKRKNSKIL